MIMSGHASVPAAHPMQPPANHHPSRAFSGSGVPPQPMQGYYSSAPPPPPTDYDHRCTVCMNTIVAMIEAQPQRIMDAFAPRFASLGADIDSLKTSFDRVQASSSKVQRDVSKVQRDVSNVQHDVSKISTQISNMNETLSTVGRAQGSSLVATGLSRPPIYAESSTTPFRVQSGRGQTQSSGSTPSMDVDMIHMVVPHEALPHPAPSAQTSPLHLSAPPSISASRRAADFSNGPTRRQWNLGEVSLSFSKADWGVGVSASSQSTPAPTRHFPALPTRLSRTSHVNDHGNDSSPPDSRPHSEERHEVQQLPSPPAMSRHSQSEEMSVQLQLQPSSQSQSQSPPTHRRTEPRALPINLGHHPLPPSCSVSSSQSSSTGLFSPVSPQMSAISRGEIPRRVQDFLGPHEEGMPLTTFAMSDLLQYPTQPEEEEAGNGGERNGEDDAKSNNEEGGSVDVRACPDKEMSELGERSVGQGEYPFPARLPTTPLEEQTKLHEEKEELQPQQPMKRKTPLFLPESGPPSVKSMSPVPAARSANFVEKMEEQKSGELSQQRRQREVEEDQVSRNLMLSSDHSQRQPRSPPSLPPSSPPFPHESQSSQTVAKLLTELTPRKDHREGSVGDGRDQQQQQPVESPDSIRRLPITSSDEVDLVMAQLTVLSEIDSSDESDESDEDEGGEEVDELLEDDLLPHSFDRAGPSATQGFQSQAIVERTLVPESQRQQVEEDKDDKETMEDGQQGRGVEQRTELESQVEVRKALVMESQSPQQEVEEDNEIIQEVGDLDEPESQTQLDLPAMLIPQSQMREEDDDDEPMEDVRQEIDGVESESGTQIDLPGMLIYESQVREEEGGGEERYANGGQLENELEAQPPLETQVDLPAMLVPQSPIEEEDKGREEVETAGQETSRDLVPSSVDGDARSEDIPMHVESSIDTFTPRMEVRDPIESFQRMEEEESLSQGREREELDDGQMQVDDDGSHFENHHHETDHLSASLSCQNGLEKSSTSKLCDLVQPGESRPTPTPWNDEAEFPLSPPPPPPLPHDENSESSIELTPPPSTQVPNNNFLRDSETTGDVVPPSPSRSMSPTSPIQMPNPTQQKQQQPAAPVVPVALPEYISPVNSPSPSKSPLPVLRFGRKRKLDEMMMLSTPSLNGALGATGGNGSNGKRRDQVKQVQLVTPTAGGRVRKRMALNARSGARNESVSISPDGVRNADNRGSGSGKRMQNGVRKSAPVVVVTPTRNRSALRKEKKGEGWSEENPICLSSTPSPPPDEVGDKDSLSKEKRKEDKGKGKEKEKELQKGMNETEKEREREKQKEEEKKKKEKEKKMMPVGMEDSDDAEVIPARAFKAPEPVAGSASDDEQHNRKEKKSHRTTGVPVLDLNGIRDRKNKAMTKVKKKTRIGGGGNAPAGPQKKVVDGDGEPPLKRARGRSDDRGTSNVGASAASGSGSGSGSKGRVLRKEATGLSAARIEWPKKSGERRSDRNFVKCDKCSMWYHYGCVGILVRDDRLKDDVIFTCPPCSTGGTVAGSQGAGGGQKSTRKNASKRNSTSEVCARPDCAFQNSSDEFWVKRVVGRKAKAEGGRGRVVVYLVEWEGYPLGEATWQEEDTMGNPAELIAEFARAARKEGVDLDRDPDRTVLLKDALRAGWTVDD